MCFRNLLLYGSTLTKGVGQSLGSHTSVTAVEGGAQTQHGRGGAVLLDTACCKLCRAVLGIIDISHGRWGAGMLRLVEWVEGQQGVKLTSWLRGAVAIAALLLDRPAANSHCCNMCRAKQGRLLCSF